MRNLIVTLAVLAACGPAAGHSERDVAMAKQARYQGDKLQLFAAMKSSVEGKYKLEVSDETKLAMKTIGRWYTPEGTVSNWTPADARGPDRGLPDRSLNISLVAELLPEGDNWIVHIVPVILRFNDGSPKLDPLRPDDPSLPGFVNGKSDELAFAIWKKMQPFEIKSPGGVAPAPVAPAPSPTPEAAGSGSATP